MEYDRDKYITISKLAQEFGRVSDATIRRYLKQYSEYFKVVRIDGWQQVEKEFALKTLDVIERSVAVGRNRGGHDVRDALRKAEIDPIPQAESDQPSQSQPVNTDSKRMVVELCKEDRELIKELLKSKKGD
jgi:hypothetical protein